MGMTRMKTEAGLDLKSTAFLIGLAIIFSVGMAWGYYQYSFAQFKARNTHEKQTILRLVTAFVSTYSEHRKFSKSNDLNVPATFRAKALAQYNKLSHGVNQTGLATKVEMIGVPGLEIANKGKDAHVKKLVAEMAKGRSADIWNGFISPSGEKVFRAVKPVIASKDSCVSCHNGLQVGRKTWVKGDVMGAYVMDTPVASFLKNLIVAASLFGLVIFLATIAIGIFVMKSFGRQSAIKQKAQQQAEREIILTSAREQAEQEANNLSAQVSVINAELIETNKQLVENLDSLHTANDQLLKKGKMAQLGQLTATVAHEIRNPLGTIRTSSYLINRKFSSDNPKLAKPLGRITKAVERCDSIITELLDFARTRNLALKPADFDEWIVEIVQEQLEKIPPLVKIECHLGLNGQHVTFDKDIMRRALINFISNASEAMVGKDASPSEILVSDPKIVITTFTTNRGVELSVTDNGPGISAEILEKILEPLFTTKSFGVGLGLPAVEKIFEQHGGGMEIESVVGDGATFTGWIPLNIEQSKAA